MSDTQSSEWIEWNGGKCPVDEFTVVDVKDRDGTLWERWPAVHHDWSHGTDFPNEEPIAYRVVKP